MDYEDKTKSVADCLMSYRKDASGWKVCKKSMYLSFIQCGLKQHNSCSLYHWDLNKATQLSKIYIHLEVHGYSALLTYLNNDVVVSWRPSSEFLGNVYKGEGIVNGSPENVWECLKPIPNGLRVSWDKNVKMFQLLEQITEDISICRTVTPSAAMGIIAPRDFVDVILIKQYEDGTISSNATNVIHTGCPPQSGYVRGFNHPCGCICVPVSGEPKKTQVFSFFQTDLSGLLPRSVVDSFFPSSMTEFYSNLSKAVKSLKDL